MFDDEELDQLREDEDEWKGHVNREKVQTSRTSRKALTGSLAASFALTAVVLTMVFSGMMASALIGVSGIGGFYADIGELTGTDIAIYPAVGPTAACDSSIDFNNAGPQGTDTTTLPQLRGEIGGATVPAGQKLSFIKDVNTPSVTGIDMFRLNITASNPSSDINLLNATLYLTGLEAGNLTLENAQIREFFSDGTSSNPRFYDGGAGTDVLNGTANPGEFAIRNRPGTNANAAIKNAEARAHFIAFERLDIPDVDLQLQYFQDGSNAANPSNTSAEDSCPTPP